jgi:uncharacterized protein
MNQPWRIVPEGIIIACRLTPKGGRDALESVAELSDGARIVRARVRAAPEDGLANKALCAPLARQFGIAASQVSLVTGAKSRTKHVAIAGEPVALIARLAELCQLQ